MKFLPSSRSESLGLLSRPFQAYIFLAGFFYFHWLDELRGTNRQLDLIMRDDGLAFFSGGYLVCFAALTTIAIVQAPSGRRRAALWNAVFAVAAMVIGFRLLPPDLH